MLSRLLLLLLLLVPFVLVAACGSEPLTEHVPPPQPTTTPAPRVVPTTPAPTAPIGTANSPLEELRLGVVGRWVGKATYTLDETRSFSLWLDLYADGHYSAGCLDDACFAAFTQGNDGDWPTKRYSIYDLAADGSGVGDLYLLIGADGKVEPTTLRQALEGVRLSDGNKSLTFLFRMRSPSSKPLRYDLKRVG